MRRLTARITGLACIATLAIGGGLALQMASGADPALGSKAAAGRNGARQTPLDTTTTTTATPVPVPSPTPAPAPVQTATS